MKPGECGRAAENAARAYLRGLGREVLTANYRTRWGEIDIIALHGATVCFTEVRSRKRGSMVSPGESVDAGKQERLVRAASLWLAETGTEAPCRFDVMEVEFRGNLASVVCLHENCILQADP